MDTPICLWMSLKHFRITTSNVFTRRCFNSRFGRLMQITRYKMIEVSTKHQLHEVPCFFFCGEAWSGSRAILLSDWSWLVRWWRSHQMGVLLKYGISGRSKKNVSPWNLPENHLGGSDTPFSSMFRHTQATIFVEFVESVGIPCHPIVKSSWNRRNQGINRSKITVFSSNQQWYPQ